MCVIDVHNCHVSLALVKILNVVLRLVFSGCDPCPDGYFSKGGADKCRHWRNCTAEGKRTLRPGKQDEDAICDDQSSVPKGSTTISLPSSPVQETVAPPTKPRPMEANLTTHLKEPRPGTSDPRFVAAFVIGALLLVAGGASALLLFLWKSKKKHQQLERPEVPSGLPHEDERSSFRIPIQEEQTDSKSSLVQN
ncbi:tumor necrosis factor receptor superfamily member 4-like [Sceloporus undulatus]|uniref:tumor necrosis factor receptor superfamily member 4-like n=1 Tax=Sceloporus undulatus TaxID=8520 RepID=UPI001C4BAEF3|nr:tumor necrosis factor receptor superfamily member 4-like [Sceloporus undulatus]